MKLNELKAGDKATVSDVPLDIINVWHMGIMPGVEIECESVFGESVLIKFQDSKVMIGGDASNQIMVVRS